MTLPIRFADAHVHFWDLAGTFDYSWLDGPDDGFLGRVSEIRIADWSPERFDEETRFTPPSFVVHVQASNPPTPSWLETAWVVEKRSAKGSPHALVCRLDLRADDITPELVANLEAGGGRVIGVRDMASTGALADPRVERNLAHIAAAGLHWEASFIPGEAATVRALAGSLPDLTVVVGHSGWPGSRNAAELERWRADLVTLADAPNIICKVSGPGMTDHAWTADRWAPIVTGCLDAFGPGRCIFGSDWPVDRIYASYESQLRIYADILDDAGLSASELDAFWYTNAIRLYASKEGINA
jgi:predicted TIM-barrel fold metal-dependent hydrolase